MLDKRLFKEIMTNLIKNAIKYTERGGIIIESLIKNDYVEINIRDTGIGIPRDKYKVIFEEFRQESEGYSRSFEGTGLGLTLAKRYAELMRGNISVKSELGVGSVFTVRLPLRSERKGFIPNGLLKEENLKDETPKDELRKILLVENDKINANLIRLYLRNLYEVTLAVNGNEALELTSKNKYDAILMDINLGESINGVEVTKILRKIPDYKNTPIIAVTAFAMKGDKEEFFEAGLDYYIAKPFYKSKLIGLLDSIFNQKGK
jgi:CheY-like chemotaxis protein/anti-sigma regulatory factor (Ser/Thr protein kinase)